MDNRTKALVAIGASVAANCEPCLAWHISKAREAGADDKDMVMAIEVAKAVRTSAVSNMDAFSQTAVDKSAKGQPSTGCGCRC